MTIKSIQTDRSELVLKLASYLSDQLQDQELAECLARSLSDCILDWQPPSEDLVGTDYIIAFSFGARTLPNGNLIPGPMNDQIAELALALHRSTGCPIIAQWEVAASLFGRCDASSIITINPEFSLIDGTVQYLSTEDVIQKAAEIVCTTRPGAKVLVAAWRHHAYRCVAHARAAGLDAYAPPLPLPGNYDIESAQPWTCDALTYLIHDIFARIHTLREAMLTGVRSPRINSEIEPRSPLW